MNGEFSVYWFDMIGGSYAEAQFVDVAAAIRTAFSIAERRAARAGMIERVIITDGGDRTVLEWKHGAGITYPQSEEGT